MMAESAECGVQKEVIYQGNLYQVHLMISCDWARTESGLAHREIVRSLSSRLDIESPGKGPAAAAGTCNVYPPIFTGYLVETIPIGLHRLYASCEEIV